jgi:RNA polymerase sigma-70 factor (ECF subfamily)
LTSCTQNGLAVRYVVGELVFELGKVASCPPREHTRVDKEEEYCTALMTLSEKVLALFEQLRVPIFGYLLRKTRDAGEAEDLTQETFLRLCRHLQEERPLDNPKAWLFTVANNLAIDKNRNDHNVKDLDESVWKEIEESRAGQQSDPEKLLLQHERLDRLHLAVLNLTKLQRECLHLRADGLRYREIAELMGVSMSTVVDAVRRATVNLAREFNAEVPA